MLLLKAWLKEQGPALIGARLRTVTQYDQRSLLLQLSSEEGTLALLLSVLEEYPVLALLTPALRERHGLPEPSEGEPESSFAKALNFHLSGYQLDSISQESFDRSVVFTFTRRDMYGKETLKLLRHELVGRASNAYLLSERGMVVSIMKRVRREQNRVRHIITGKPLPPPPPLDKYLAAESGAEGLEVQLAADSGQELAHDSGTLEQFFVQRVAGCDARLWPALEPLLPVEYDIESLYQFILRLQRGELTAELFALREHGDANRRALADWSGARARRGVRQPAGNPRRERAAQRLEQLMEQLRATEQAEALEQLGMALLNQAGELDASGRAGAHLVDWQQRYPHWAELVSTGRSVGDNAQELIHQAQRLRRGSDKLQQLVAEAQAELERAEQPPVARATTAAAKLAPAIARLDKHGVKYLRFVSSDRLHIVCGLSDRGNDELLRAFGSARHLWLHARDYPGSHVIVLSAGHDVPQRTLEEAAVIAAWHSQGREEGTLEVSYLPLTQLRRPRDGKPGQVLKVSEKVLTVRPAQFQELKQQLRYQQ